MQVNSYIPALLWHPYMLDSSYYVVSYCWESNTQHATKFSKCRDHTQAEYTRDIYIFC